MNCKIAKYVILTVSIMSHHVLTWCRGRPTTDENTHLGASSPANPALHIPLPLSMTTGASSRFHDESRPTDLDLRRLARFPALAHVSGKRNRLKSTAIWAYNSHGPATTARLASTSHGSVSTIQFDIFYSYRSNK
jgi:hypothetical protein